MAKKYFDSEDPIAKTIKIRNIDIPVSNIIAWPIAYYVNNEWLEDYPYRIKMNPGIFAIVGLLALLIALMTVTYQAVNAARANLQQSEKSTLASISRRSSKSSVACNPANELSRHHMTTMVII